MDMYCGCTFSKQSSGVLTRVFPLNPSGSTLMLSYYKSEVVHTAQLIHWRYFDLESTIKLTDNDHVSRLRNAAAGFCSFVNWSGSRQLTYVTTQGFTKNCSRYNYNIIRLQ